MDQRTKRTLLALLPAVVVLLRHPIRLSSSEKRDLVTFVRDGLFDRRVLDFCREIPASVPSGMPLQTFEGCD